MPTYEFKLPDIGEGIVEAEIVKWLVREGDEVVEDQPLVEVMTDKATVTIPSPKRGRVARLCGKEGEIAQVHHTLVVLDLGDGAAAKTAETRVATPGPAAASPQGPSELGPPRAPSAARTDGGNGRRVLATPVTRRIAREHGVALDRIRGTGPGGRVLKEDVLRAVAGVVPAAARAPASAPRPLAPAAGDERIPLKGLRKRIAAKMVQSKFTAPHFTFVEEVDATALKEFRARLNADLGQAGDALKVSYLPIVCKALVAALRRFPTLNANFDEATQELVVKHTFNLGIAVATDEGLTVPVVKHAEHKSLRQITDEIAALAEAARNKRLKPEDLTGGTFTITSLGEQGGLFATPIINHPEVAILGVHRMRPRPVVVDGQVVVRDVVYLSLSFDHRSIDGAVGAAFTYELIRTLEHPEMLMLDMT